MVCLISTVLVKPPVKPGSNVGGEQIAFGRVLRYTLQQTVQCSVVQCSVQCVPFPLLPFSPPLAPR
jgi:hypothetical protein